MAKMPWEDRPVYSHEQGFPEPREPLEDEDDDSGLDGADIPAEDDDDDPDVDEDFNDADFGDDGAEDDA